MRTVTNSDSALGRRSVAALLGLSVSARETCAADWQACKLSGRCDRGPRTLAHAARAVAIDHKHQAARGPGAKLRTLRSPAGHNVVKEVANAG
jgi:hypothetical protein